MNIPTDLHMSTADRLRLVADLIVAYPDKWDQHSYLDPGYRVSIGADDWSPTAAAGHLDDALHYCGTVGCLAGWGVTCTPRDEMAGFWGFGWWSRAGAQAFGFDPDLAGALFSDWDAYGLHEDDRPEPFAEVLRSLADLPEPRTLAAALRLGILNEGWDDDE